MEAINANTPEELKRMLCKRDVSVPPRGQGRTTDHTETWVSCRFLAALKNSERLQYPLHVEHCDRPDLVITLPDGQIGIELVEAVPENWARVTAHPDRAEIIPIPPNKINDPECSRREIRELARGKHFFNIRPSMGNDFERHWADAMISFINKKSKKFRQDGFDKKPTNWLHIYDNWQPSADPLAIDMLKLKLSVSGWRNPFDRIFVQRSRSVWEFGQTIGIVEHAIPSWS